MYTFKHALVQDAAYDSLLGSRRQELHGKIARVMEERPPGTRDTEPEVLAYHWQSAGEALRAIDYWLLAGQRAAYRCAGGEAESHLRAGVELAHAQPHDADMRRREISLQLALGRTLMFNRGWASADLESVWLRAHSLCHESDASDDLFSAMWGLWTYYLVRGALAQAAATALEILGLAARQDNKLWQGGGHYAAGATDYWSGNWATAGEQLSLCVACCEGYGHAVTVALYGIDVGGLAAGLADNANWVAGDFSERLLANCAPGLRSPLQPALGFAHRGARLCLPPGCRTGPR